MAEATKITHEDLMRKYGFKGLNVAQWAGPGHSYSNAPPRPRMTVPASALQRSTPPVYRYIIPSSKVPQATDDEASDEDATVGGSAKPAAPIADPLDSLFDDQDLASIADQPAASIIASSEASSGSREKSKTKLKSKSKTTSSSTISSAWLKPSLKTKKKSKAADIPQKAKEPAADVTEILIPTVEQPEAEIDEIEKLIESSSNVDIPQGLDPLAALDDIPTDVAERKEDAYTVDNPESTSAGASLDALAGEIQEEHIPDDVLPVVSDHDIIILDVESSEAQQENVVFEPPEIGLDSPGDIIPDLVLDVENIDEAAPGEFEQDLADLRTDNTVSDAPIEEEHFSKAEAETNDIDEAAKEDNATPEPDNEQITHIEETITTNEENEEAAVQSIGSEQNISDSIDALMSGISIPDDIAAMLESLPNESVKSVLKTSPKIEALDDAASTSASMDSEDKHVSFAPGTPEPKPTKRKKRKESGKPKRKPSITVIDTPKPIDLGLPSHTEGNTEVEIEEKQMPDVADIAISEFDDKVATEATPSTPTKKKAVLTRPRSSSRSTGLLAVGSLLGLGAKIKSLKSKAKKKKGDQMVVPVEAEDTPVEVFGLGVDIPAEESLNMEESGPYVVDNDVRLGVDEDAGLGMDNGAGLEVDKDAGLRLEQEADAIETTEPLQHNLQHINEREFHENVRLHTPSIDDIDMQHNIDHQAILENEPTTTDNLNAETAEANIIENENQSNEHEIIQDLQVESLHLKLDDSISADQSGPCEVVEDTLLDKEVEDDGTITTDEDTSLVSPQEHQGQDIQMDVSSQQANIDTVDENTTEVNPDVPIDNSLHDQANLQSRKDDVVDTIEDETNDIEKLPESDNDIVQLIDNQNGELEEVEQSDLEVFDTGMNTNIVDPTTIEISASSLNETISAPDPASTQHIFETSNEELATNLEDSSGIEVMVEDSPPTSLIEESQPLTSSIAMDNSPGIESSSGDHLDNDITQDDSAAAELEHCFESQTTVDQDEAAASTTELVVDPPDQESPSATDNGLTNEEVPTAEQATHTELAAQDTMQEMIEPETEVTGATDVLDDAEVSPLPTASEDYVALDGGVIDDETLHDVNIAASVEPDALPTPTAQAADSKVNNTPADDVVAETSSIPATIDVTIPVDALQSPSSPTESRSSRKHRSEPHHRPRSSRKTSHHSYSRENEKIESTRSGDRPRHDRTSKDDAADRERRKKTRNAEDLRPIAEVEMRTDEDEERRRLRRERRRAREKAEAAELAAKKAREEAEAIERANIEARRRGREQKPDNRPSTRDGKLPALSLLRGFSAGQSVTQAGLLVRTQSDTRTRGGKESKSSNRDADTKRRQRKDSGISSPVDLVVEHAGSERASTRSQTTREVVDDKLAERNSTKDDDRQHRRRVQRTDSDRGHRSERPSSKQGPAQSKNQGLLGSIFGRR